MAIASRKELRDHCLQIVDMDSTTLANQTLTNNFINDSLNEINSPGWAFLPRREVYHSWTWLRRKYSFDTVSGTEDYLLPRDFDKMAILRQEETPLRLKQISDRRFYRLDAKRDDSGNPKVYRMWEESGVSTKLAVADKIDVVSSSTDDDDDTGLIVSVRGFVSGIPRTETYTLNGTTAVTGSLTFDADDIFVSKSKETVGTITLTENSGSTTILVMAPEDRNPIFKVVSLYPIPNAAITMYVEYYTRIRLLENDGDVPQFDSKWHPVVVKGVLAKLYQHLGKETEKQSAVGFYRSSVRSMVADDQAEGDYIPKLWRHFPYYLTNFVHRSEDDVS